MRYKIRWAPRIFSLVADKKRRGEIILHDESCRAGPVDEELKKKYLAGTGIS
jgi:hypothetical protein